MSFFLNCIAFLLCWCGGAAVYLASKQQLVINKPLPTKLAWAIFILSQVVSLYVLCFLHHWLAASLILLLIVMTAWSSLTLTIPYFPNQRKALVIGTAFTLVIALTGGFYAL